MQTAQNNSRWLSVKGAANYIGASVSTLNHDRISGVLRIPFTRLGKKVLYDVHDLDAYLESRKQRWQDGEVA